MIFERHKAHYWNYTIDAVPSYFIVLNSSNKTIIGSSLFGAFISHRSFQQILSLYPTRGYHDQILF